MLIEQKLIILYLSSIYLFMYLSSIYIYIYFAKENIVSQLADFPTLLEGLFKVLVLTESDTLTL